MRLASILVLLVLLGACGAPESNSSPDTSDAVPFREDGRLLFLQEGQTILDIGIEIADDDSSRGRGLMQRPSLPEKTGMLFVFPQAGLQQFFMANTLMPLDFFFIGADSVIVNTVRYARPLSLDSIVSEGPSKFVLEVEAGFIDTYGFVAGDRVSWTDTR